MSTATAERPRQAAPLPAPAEYLGSADAARWLGVSLPRLDQSRSTGLLCGAPAPRFLKLGTRVRYRVADLRAWLEANATEHAPRDPANAAH